MTGFGLGVHVVMLTPVSFRSLNYMYLLNGGLWLEGD